jgi:phenylalanyl-tRNA synthetase beta chain
MRFSEAWLREWVSPEVDTRTLAYQLSMAGLEVDALEPAAPEFRGVVVGLVRAVAPHPSAEKLRVCEVDVGQAERLPIVCGATNVAEGMRVPVALVGAALPGDFRIKRANLRGIESLGMICSAKELGLAESSDGIMPLPADAPIGEDLRAWMGLDDTCIELDLTPDRADCLSIAGVAREVGVINRAEVRQVEIQPVPPACDARVAVQLDAPEACPRYVCRVLRNIDPSAAAPLWMQERLRRSGLRSISPVVDVTNYVLLELGQPMHGFDLARLDGGIRVRMASAGERLALLNGDNITLRDDSLVIADDARPVALAGIMGGSETAVTAETRDVLLESAFFAPAAISGRARGYGLHTDSSHRFERGIDPGLQERAIERATALLLDIVGGEPGPLVVAADADRVPRPPRLHLRRERVTKVLGVRLPDPTIEDILGRLGAQLGPVADGWEVTPPSARFDLVQEVDLIADVGRIYGYDDIPVAQALSAAPTQAPAETAFDLDRAKLTLVARGYNEVITYSFVSPELQQAIDPEREGLRLANPISAEMSVMRTGLWPGLLGIARQNLARQQGRVRIFESGLRFLPGADELVQDAVIGGLMIGLAAPEQWGERSRPADFFDVKADVQALLDLTGCPGAFRFVPAGHPALHPGQTAAIERDGRRIGLLGMLHPAQAAALDITGDAYLFEISLDGLAEGALPVFTPISRFPAIRRDLALVIGPTVSYDQVHACVTVAAGDLLREIVLFDLYQGERIESGRKSLALGLILQAPSQTLTDQEVDQTIGRVLGRLEDELGARLRD